VPTLHSTTKNKAPQVFWIRKSLLTCKISFFSLGATSLYAEVIYSYWDNVGGETLDVALTHMAQFGLIVVSRFNAKMFGDAHW